MGLPWVAASIISKYNCKPALLRPQHRYFLTDEYLEVDANVNDFSAVARKAFSAARLKCHLVEADIGLVLEGRCDDELPERMWGTFPYSRIGLDTGRTAEQAREASDRMTEADAAAAKAASTSPP